MANYIDTKIFSDDISDSKKLGYLTYESIETIKQICENSLIKFNKNDIDNKYLLNAGINICIKHWKNCINDKAYIYFATIFKNAIINAAMDKKGYQRYLSEQRNRKWTK